MSASRAVVRLWVAGSIAWMAFWTWTFTTKCVRADDGSLWCPAFVGSSMSRADRLHMASALFGPPLISLVLGLLCFLAVKASHEWLKGN